MVGIVDEKHQRIVGDQSEKGSMRTELGEARSSIMRKAQNRNRM